MTTQNESVAGSGLVISKNASLGRPRDERPRIPVPSRGWNDEALETRRGS